MRNFRDHHLLNILQTFDESTLPLDVFLSKFFREHKSIGSKDRAYICERIYLLIRWKSLIDQSCSYPLTWEKRLEVIQKEPIEKLLTDSKLPKETLCSFPKFLFDQLEKSLGPQKAFKFCIDSNESAPLTIRCNPSKISRDSLFDLWKGLHPIKKTEESKLGITFSKRINFFELKEFKEGFFEVQDEGSQLVALCVKAKQGDHVLDFCAGSGGKTLAFAHQMEGKGQIYLYDIRSHALVEAKKRLKRAGIQNVQILDKDKLKKNGMKSRMDWILLDVPCSGTGTLRRNPDMKWRYKENTVENLVAEQRKIFEESLKYLAPNGKIVYATCSVLKEENEDQIEYFLKTYNLKLEETFKSVPSPGKMDGFYAATLSKKSS